MANGLLGSSDARVAVSPYATTPAPTAPTQVAGITTPAAFWSEDLAGRIEAAGGSWPMGLVIDFDEALFMMSVNDTPLTGGTNAQGLGPLPQRPVSSTEFVWGSGPALNIPRAVTVGNGTATTFIIPQGYEGRFRVNDLVRLGNNKVGRITAIAAPSGGTVTVTFAAASGTTPVIADTATGTTILGMGVLAPEGSDPVLVGTKGIDAYSNYTRIYGPYSMRVTGTQDAIRKRWQALTMMAQLADRMQEVAIARENDILHSVRWYDDVTRQRTFGGIHFFIDAIGYKFDAAAARPGGANGSVAAGALDPYVIGQLLQNTTARGAVPDQLVVNPVSLDALNWADRNLITLDVNDSRRGITRVTAIRTEFGDVTLLRNRWVIPSYAYAYNRNQVVRRVLRPMQATDLGKKGDYREVMFVAEEGLMFKGAESAALIYGLSGTDTQILPQVAG